MSAAAFDTLTTARDLEAAGVERRQAEAHAEALRRAVSAISADREALATKADLDTAIAGLESRVDAKLASLKARLTWRLVGIAAAIVVAVKLIPGLD